MKSQRKINYPRMYFDLLKADSSFIDVITRSGLTVRICALPGRHYRNQHPIKKPPTNSYFILKLSFPYFGQEPYLYRELHLRHVVIRGECSISYEIENCPMGTMTFLFIFSRIIIALPSSLVFGHQRSIHKKFSQTF